MKTQVNGGRLAMKRPILGSWTAESAVYKVQDWDVRTSCGIIKVDIRVAQESEITNSFTKCRDCRLP